MEEVSLRFAVFDCDGTLVDSVQSIVEAMSHAWVAEGLGMPPSVTQVRTIVGLPLVEAIAQLYPQGEAADYGRLAEHYKSAFLDIRNGPNYHEPLYSGTKEVIDFLDSAGVLLGVATGKSRRGLQATLERHGLLGRFISLKTAEDGPGKPNPAILLDAMKEVGVMPQHTVMIGDTVFDMAMASNANVAAIGVEWGYHEPVELEAAGAKRVLSSFNELACALRSIWGTL